MEEQEMLTAEDKAEPPSPDSEVVRQSPEMDGQSPEMDGQPEDDDQEIHRSMSVFSDFSFGERATDSSEEGEERPTESTLPMLLASLTVFPPDVPIPIHTVMRYWKELNGMDACEVKRLLGYFAAERSITVLGELKWENMPTATAVSREIEVEPMTAAQCSRNAKAKLEKLVQEQERSEGQVKHVRAKGSVASVATARTGRSSIFSKAPSVFTSSIRGERDSPPIFEIPPASRKNLTTGYRGELFDAFVAIQLTPDQWQSASRKLPPSAGILGGETCIGLVNVERSDYDEDGSVGSLSGGSHEVVVLPRQDALASKWATASLADTAREEREARQAGQRAADVKGVLELSLTAMGVMGREASTKFTERALVSVTTRQKHETQSETLPCTHVAAMERLHAVLIDSWWKCVPNGTEWYLGPEDGYYAGHLSDHLARARLPPICSIEFALLKMLMTQRITTKDFGIEAVGMHLMIARRSTEEITKAAHNLRRITKKLRTSSVKDQVGAFGSRVTPVMFQSRALFSHVRSYLMNELPVASRLQTGDLEPVVMAASLLCPTATIRDACDALVRESRHLRYIQLLLAQLLAAALESDQEDWYASTWIAPAVVDGWVWHVKCLPATLIGLLPDPIPENSPPELLTILFHYHQRYPDIAVRNNVARLIRSSPGTHVTDPLLGILRATGKGDYVQKKMVHVDRVTSFDDPLEGTVSAEAAVATITAYSKFPSIDASREYRHACELILEIRDALQGRLPPPPQNKDAFLLVAVEDEGSGDESEGLGVVLSPLSRARGSQPTDVAPAATIDVEEVRKMQKLAAGRALITRNEATLEKLLEGPKGWLIKVYAEVDELARMPGSRAVRVVCDALLRLWRPGQGSPTDEDMAVHAPEVLHLARDCLNPLDSSALVAAIRVLPLCVVHDRGCLSTLLGIIQNHFSSMVQAEAAALCQLAPERHHQWMEHTIAHILLRPDAPFPPQLLDACPRLSNNPSPILLDLVLSRTENGCPSAAALLRRSPTFEASRRLAKAGNAPWALGALPPISSSTSMDLLSCVSTPGALQIPEVRRACRKGDADSRLIEALLRTLENATSHREIVDTLSSLPSFSRFDKAGFTGLFQIAITSHPAALVLQDLLQKGCTAIPQYKSVELEPECDDTRQSLVAEVVVEYIATTLAVPIRWEFNYAAAIRCAPNCTLQVCDRSHHVIEAMLRFVWHSPILAVREAARDLFLRSKHGAHLLQKELTKALTFYNDSNIGLFGIPYPSPEVEAPPDKKRLPYLAVTMVVMSGVVGAHHINAVNDRYYEDRYLTLQHVTHTEFCRILDGLPDDLSLFGIRQATIITEYCRGHPEPDVREKCTQLTQTRGGVVSMLNLLQLKLGLNMASETYETLEVFPANLTVADDDLVAMLIAIAKDHTSKSAQCRAQNLLSQNNSSRLVQRMLCEELGQWQRYPDDIIMKLLQCVSVENLQWGYINVLTRLLVSASLPVRDLVFNILTGGAPSLRANHYRHGVHQPSCCEPIIPVLFRTLRFGSTQSLVPSQNTSLLHIIALLDLYGLGRCLETPLIESLVRLLPSHEANAPMVDGILKVLMRCNAKAAVLILAGILKWQKASTAGCPPALAVLVAKGLPLFPTWDDVAEFNRTALHTERLQLRVEVLRDRDRASVHSMRASTLHGLDESTFNSSVRGQRYGLSTEVDMRVDKWTYTRVRDTILNHALDDTKPADGRNAISALCRRSPSLWPDLTQYISSALLPTPKVRLTTALLKKAACATNSIASLKALGSPRLVDAACRVLDGEGERDCVEALAGPLRRLILEEETPIA